MIFRVLPFLLVIASNYAQAYELPIEVIEYLDNRKVVAFINEGDIDKTQHWTPFEEAPSLTVEGALKAIKQYAAADPEYAKATLTGIELKPIPHHEGYWHYLVKLKTPFNDTFRSHYFIVLMNGKVISGIREPDTVR